MPISKQKQVPDFTTLNLDLRQSCYNETIHNDLKKESSVTPGSNLELIDEHLT